MEACKMPSYLAQLFVIRTSAVDWFAQLPVGVSARWLGIHVSTALNGLYCSGTLPLLIFVSLVHFIALHIIYGELFHLPTERP